MYLKLAANREHRARSARKVFCVVVLFGFIVALTSLTYLVFIDYINCIFVLFARYRLHLGRSFTVVCYYNLPSNGDDIWNLPQSKIDPHICTHIIVGFAGINNDTLSLGEKLSDYQKVVDLKKENHLLKVMLSVGGAGEESSSQFRSMTENHAKRKVFIQSVLKTIEALHLDGLDIDWEYPSWLHLESEEERTNSSWKNFNLGNEREKIHFVQLLQELRKAFDKTGFQLLLSAAVGAPKAIVDQSYNVPQIAEHVDFVNLMSYDYHFYIPYYPVTDLNSPLFSSKLDKNYLSHLNVNFSANYWVEKGMPRDKIVVGIPTYGHTYELFNYENHDLHSPVKNVGKIGSNGFANFSAICKFLMSGANEAFVTESRVPYAYKGTEWISYDDVRSVTFKALWIKENNFRGAMVYSLNSDDWDGSCWANKTFYLIRSINYHLNTV